MLLSVVQKGLKSQWAISAVSKAGLRNVTQTSFLLSPSICHPNDWLMILMSTYAILRLWSSLGTSRRPRLRSASRPLTCLQRAWWSTPIERRWNELCECLWRREPMRSLSRSVLPFHWHSWTLIDRGVGLQAFCGGFWFTSTPTAFESS